MILRDLHVKEFMNLKKFSFIQQYQWFNMNYYFYLLLSLYKGK